MTGRPRADGAVLVTGASGYLGSRLVAALGPSGAVPVVRRPVPWVQNAVEADLESEALPAEAWDGVSSLVHLAGPNEVVTVKAPDVALHATEAMARSVAAAAVRAGITRLVYVSTVHVYGANVRPGMGIDETLEPAPAHPYASARLVAERAVAEAAGRDADVVILRLTNGVGAPVHPDVARWTLVANDLCRQAVVSGALALQTSGQQFRDFIALTDVIDVLCAAARGEVPAGLYNLGSGCPTSVRQLAELVQDVGASVLGERPPLHAPPAEGPAEPASPVDVRRLAAAGFRAQTPVRAAVEETMRFCLTHRRALAA